MKNIDLATLDTVSACNTGTEIELVHPVTQAPLGIFIGILGKDSDVFREHLRETINEDLRRAAMAKKRGKSEELRTVEQSEERGLELLVLCTTHWRTGEEKTLTLKGEALPFNVANAKKVYSTIPWIKDQVDSGIVDLENFMKS